MKKRVSLHSKRGVSLVEEICAVCVLAVGIFAAVALISLSRTSVSSDGVKETAAAQAQQLADNLIAQMSRQTYTTPASITVKDVGGISAADVCSESALGAKGYDKQFCVKPCVSSEDSKTDGYQIVCRVYYNGRKNYVQFHAYASARGNS